MSESTRTRTLLTTLRGASDLVTLKHSDRFTTGIPDLSVTGHGRTSWLELKDPPVKVDLLNYVRESMSQLVTMCRLDYPTGWAHYIIWRKDRLCLWAPYQLLQYVRDVATEAHITYKDVAEDEFYERRHVLSTLYNGGQPLRWPGPCYGVVANLLRSDYEPVLKEIV